VFDAEAANKRLTDTSGVDEKDMLARIKFGKAVGLFPHKPKGPRDLTPIPQIDSVHVVALLFAAMAGGMQTRSPEYVAALWRLPFATTTGNGGRKLRSLPISFGYRILDLMDQAVSEKRVT
jgi:hypothetical protein